MARIQALPLHQLSLSLVTWDTNGKSVVKNTVEACETQYQLEGCDERESNGEVSLEGRNVHEDESYWDGHTDRSHASNASTFDWGSWRKYKE